jgi:4-amino-4-deoxy-L-arabinose transferase-like glycosyltransferase
LQASSSAFSASTAKAIRANAVAAIRKHSLVFAYFAAVVPALLMAVTQPVWSVIDEAQHFDFIVQLGHGVYPVADQTLIDAETLEISKSTGVFRAFYLPGTYPSPDLADIGRPPPAMSSRANAAWMVRHLWQLSHESVQTPVYYLSMVPVWWAADRLGGPVVAVYILRIVNALILASLAPMAVLVARALAPARADVVVVAALFAVLLPGLDLNGTRVSNDALAAAIGGFIVLLAVRWAGDGWTWRRAALMGVLLGVGLMAKLTLAGLVPAVVLSALWAGGSIRYANLRRLTLSGAIAFACVVPWLVVNLQQYRELMGGSRTGRLSDSVPGSFTGTFIPLDVAVFHLTYWTGEPWGALPLAGVMAILAGLIVLMVPAGIVAWLRSRGLNGPLAPLAVAGAAVSGLIALALLLPVTNGFEFVGPGRYAYPALPAAAVLCAIGVLFVLPNTLAHRAVAATYAGLAVVMLAGSAAGLPAGPGAGTRTPPVAAKTLEVSASGRQGGMTITIDRVAFDWQAKATWFAVTATNSASDEAEWTVPPQVSDGEVSAAGQYLLSTQMPGDIDSGQTVKGWLYVPLDPSGLHAGRALQLTFRDVATDNYRTVGDIVIEVPVVVIPASAG